TGQPATAAVLDFDLPLAEGTKYAAVAYDALNNITALPLTDDDTNIATGDIRLQIAHVAVGVGEVDIYDVSTGNVVAENLGFGASDVVDVPASAYNLGFDTNDDGVAELIFAVPDLGSEVLVDVFAVTESDGTPFLHAQFEDGSEARVDLAPSANVRVLHLSPDAPNVDVFVNDVRSGIVDLPYETSTTYVELNAGLTNFKVVGTGAALGTEVLDFDVNLQPGEFYTAVAYGAFATIDALLLVDDYDAINTGDVRILVGHAADGVGTVDVLNVSASGLLVPDLTYGTTDVVDVPDAARTLGLDTDQDGSADFLFDVPALGADTLVNVFAVLPATGPVLVAQFDDGSTVTLDAYQPARVRVLHASPDAPNVDVFVDDVRSGVIDLAFTEGTSYIAFAPGLYNFKVAEAGFTAADAVLDFDLTLEADTLYSAVAYGDVLNITPLDLVDDVDGIPQGSTRLQLSHIADGVGQVDIWRFSGGRPTLLLENVNYGTTGTVEYAAGPIRVGIDTNDDGGYEFTFDLPNLGADTQVNGFAVLDEVGAPFILAHLPDGSTVSVPAN
ncbi:MAG: DUF4397 domain-containing protein, partial [Proteobacteria bacterium]|nr:DUF4397 domain-containing protein [Pseudomonadota bacterium]